MKSEERLQALQGQMAKAGVDLTALGPGAHMQYLLGFAPHPDERPCLLLVSANGSTMLMPSLNADGSREHTDQSFHMWADADGPDTALKTALADIGAGNAETISLDETMRADFALLLKDHLPNARHVFTEATVGALRMCKDEDEYAVLKRNALLNDRAFLAAAEAIKPGMSELEIAAVVREAHGTEDGRTEFCIVGAGGNGAFPHHATGERKVAAGDAIVVDIGARKDGFPSDMTRMVVVGEPPEGYEEVHSVVEAAVQAAMAAARPGVEARVVDKAARDVISAAGYGDYFMHRTGHGLGIEVHEPPYITSTSKTVLQEGAVFSIEPGIYLSGRFGIRLEDIVILRADGPEILSGLSRDFVTVAV
ncbi:M24 family metallopeptidase [Pseudahrensia aquimaris]|uniref:M24 family metallopeptidase n=1 Tax=Pseudahrensia aquimaris TaxID=744461 RepID=A0ABW3FDT8_9HYPH